jgi:hypothetical protein
MGKDLEEGSGIVGCKICQYDELSQAGIIFRGA